ncbi:MAG: hypothetical protein HLX51_01645 [Micrococcaceae bacterium]|nr:hypothetical protein [Micrococcaceae bacterium]
MKRKHIILAALTTAALTLTSCGEPSATQQTCDQIADLYESVGNQWLPEITTGIKDRDAAQHAERVADEWSNIAQSSDDTELQQLMGQLQPVLDVYRYYADQPMGDHPKDDAEIQQKWSETSEAIGDQCL